MGVSDIDLPFVYVWNLSLRKLVKLMHTILWFSDNSELAIC